MNRRIKIISLVLIFLGTLVLALPVLAANVEECEGVGKVEWLGEVTGIKHGLIIPCGCLQTPPGECGLTQVLQVIVNLSKLLLALTGSAALLMFIYGGTLWILAAGNQERVQKGKDAMQAAAIGIIIIMGAFLIVNFVIFALLGKEYSDIGGVQLFDQPWFQEQKVGPQPALPGSTPGLEAYVVPEINTEEKCREWGEGPGNTCQWDGDNNQCICTSSY